MLILPRLSHPARVRLLFWGGMLSVFGILWTLLHLVLPLQGQEPPPASPAPAHLQQVRRLCVEDFEGGENARQLRAMLMDQLQRLGAFALTENPARADAYLRGFAEDLVFTEQHQRDEISGVRAQSSNATGGYTRNRRANSSSIGANEAIRERSSERRHEAALTVRIVNVDGDVLWTGSAESRGGKYRSASAEVSARVVADLRKALQADEAAPSAEAPRAEPPTEDPPVADPQPTGSASSPASASPAPN